MFDILYTYKVAFFPFSALFITAFSEAPAIYLPEVERFVLSSVLAILEKAQNSYQSIIIANEPTINTHSLNFETTRNAIAVCCSLQFKSAVDMNSFIQKEIKNEK